jgi:hypothetical protein
MVSLLWSGGVQVTETEGLRVTRANFRGWKKFQEWIEKRRTTQILVLLMISVTGDTNCRG